MNTNAQRIRILLVEDDEDDYLVTRDLLSEIEGTTYDMEWVPSYESGLECMKEHRHDINLFDYSLGGHTGLELLRHAGLCHCPAPTILLTGYGDRGIDQEAMSMGAVDYLVKGQINAPLLERSIRYALEQKRVEAEREELNAKLLETARQLGKAEVATNVLHDVGNVLNSVSVISHQLHDNIQQSCIGDIKSIAEMLHHHADDIGEYLTHDHKGRQIPDYLAKLGENLLIQNTRALDELMCLHANLDHVRRVIQAQQTFAKSRTHTEPAVPAELMEQALIINQATLDQDRIQVVRAYAELPQVMIDRHQVLQILVNLIRNAHHAMTDLPGQPHQLTLGIQPCVDQQKYIRFQVCDTGVGIPVENLTRIFAQGFTTKKDGHGFGLHGSALAAKVMNGSLRAWSDGEGTGATFTLDLPMIPVEATTS